MTNQTFTKSKKRIFRIYFRAKIGTIPVAGEINITTTKERWKIDHEEIIEKTLLEQGGGYATFTDIIDCEEII